MKKTARLSTKFATILLLVATAGTCVGFSFFSFGKHQVICDQTKVQAENADYKFKKGSYVDLTIPTTAPAIDYKFTVEGVQEYYIGYDRSKNYILQFKMPANDVKVDFSIAEQSNVLNLELPENPTTGFTWWHEITPTGILELGKDKYVSKPNYSHEPVDGLGGTRLWQFKIIGSGTVEITMGESRGNEHIGSKTIYKYEADGQTAKLVEKRTAKEIEDM